MEAERQNQLSDSVRNALRSYLNAIRRADSIDPRRRREILRSLLRGEVRFAGVQRHELRSGALEEASAEIESFAERGLRCLSPFDPEYPRLLTHISGPPLLLFVRGGIPAATVNIALVGPRSPTESARSMAFELARELARRGACIVSGLARGVDTAAHRGALAAGGNPGAAVLGSGVLAPYPRENSKLCDEIVDAGGVVMSEYDPLASPRKHHFPERNRIVSGMSSGVVVIEAGERSGAMITARLAAEEGREVLAVPGSPLSERSAGANRLLREGAHVVTRAEDVWDVLVQVLPERRGSADTGSKREGLSELQIDLLELLEREGAQAPDQISCHLEAPISLVLADLSLLELGGRVLRGGDGTYLVRRNGAH